MKQPHKVYGINTAYMIAVELMALAENLRLNKSYRAKAPDLEYSQGRLPGGGTI